MVPASTADDPGGDPSAPPPRLPGPGDEEEADLGELFGKVPIAVAYLVTLLVFLLLMLLLVRLVVPGPLAS